MKKVMFLASLLVCGSTVFAQSLDFYSEGKKIEEGATVTATKVEYEMIVAPVVVKNEGGAGVNATMTATLMELSGEGSVGYCGWGTGSCAGLTLNSPYGRTTIVEAGSEMDPQIDALNVEEGFRAKVKMELTYESATKIMYIQFVNDPTSIISSAKSGKNVVVNAKEGIANVSYNFDSEGVRVMNIYNVTGKLVASKVVSGLEGNLSFSLDKGIYLYSIVEKGKVAGTSKFAIN